MIAYVNGSYLEASAAKISIFDGGFLFGDGLFETMRLYTGRPFDLAGHLARLNRELDLLGFTWRADTGMVRDVARELVERNGMADRDARMRLIVSRGTLTHERLTLQNLQELEPTVVATLDPLPAEWPAWHRDGIHAAVMKPAFARGNFPQLKTLNYLPSLMALRFAAASDCQEAILVDRQGMLLEGATSNIFLVMGGRVLTTPVRLGILAGRTRSRVIGAAHELGYACEEAACNRRDLATAEEVFLTSTVREVIPVVKIGHSTVGDGRPGPITRTLQEKYRQVVDTVLAEESD